ncbi:MAG: HEAT repeat domain-containing protein [Candidatus Binataceae bacterium]
MILTTLRVVAAADPQECASAHSVKSLIQQLQGSDAAGRVIAGICLTQMQPIPPEAIPALMQAMAAANQKGMTFPWPGLLPNMTAVDLPELAIALDDPDDYVQRVAVIAIVEIANREPQPATWPLLIHAFKLKNAPGVVYPIVKGGSAVVPLLSRALQSQDVLTRTRAAQALFGMGPVASGADKGLIIALNDPDKNVRRLAAAALANFDPHQKIAVPILVDALTTGDSDYLRAVDAAKALGKMKGDAADAVPALGRALLATSPPEAQPNATYMDALQAKVRIADTVRLRAAAADSLASIGTPAAALALGEALALDKPLETRRAAGQALKEMGAAAEPALPALINILSDDPDPPVQYTAILAIHAIGPKATAAIPVLLRELGNDNGASGPVTVDNIYFRGRTVRDIASQTLGKLGAPAVPA